MGNEMYDSPYTDIIWFDRDVLADDKGIDPTYSNTNENAVTDPDDEDLW